MSVTQYVTVLEWNKICVRLFSPDFDWLTVAFDEQPQV